MASVISRASSTSSPPKKIWTTLLTNRGYLGGLLVLDHSIKKHGSVHPLVVMISGPVASDVPFLHTLESAGIPVRVVDKIEPKPRKDGRKGKKGTWEKLAPWSFVEYERVVLLDSDQIALQNFDELMTMDIGKDNIAASHACTCNPRKLAHYPKDWVPENCAFTAADTSTGQPAPLTPSSPKNHRLLNSGTVVLEPSQAQYDALIEALDTHPAVPDMIFFDQDLLPIVYPEWKMLPYIYNGLKTLRECHAALWKDDQVKILHYILQKPWQSRTVEPDIVGVQHKLWWDLYEELEQEWLASGNETRISLWNEVVRPQVAQIEAPATGFPWRQVVAERTLPPAYQLPDMLRTTESILLAVLLAVLLGFFGGRLSRSATVGPARKPTKAKKLQ